MTKIRDGEAKKRSKATLTVTDSVTREVAELPIKPVVKTPAPKKPRTPKAPK